MCFVDVVYKNAGDKHGSFLFYAIFVDNPFLPLYCLSFFDIRFLITPLVYSNFSVETWFVEKLFISKKTIKYTTSCSRYNKINIKNIQGERFGGFSFLLLLLFYCLLCYCPSAVNKWRYNARPNKKGFLLVFTVTNILFLEKQISEMWGKIQFNNLFSETEIIKCWCFDWQYIRYWW